MSCILSDALPGAAAVSGAGGSFAFGSHRTDRLRDPLHEPFGGRGGAADAHRPHSLEPCRVQLRGLLDVAAAGVGPAAHLVEDLAVRGFAAADEHDGVETRRELRQVRLAARDLPADRVVEAHLRRIGRPATHFGAELFEQGDALRGLRKEVYRPCEVDLREVFGALDDAITGKLEYRGRQRQRFKNSNEAIKAGVFYSSEDRKRYGLVLTSDIAYNASLSSLDKYINNGLFINRDKEYGKVKEMVKKLRIKTPSILQRAGNLSGGNQQKVCLAKALMTEPKVLILDEATRGIDIGAKTEIYQLINQMAAQGIAVIMISSEESELIGLCDRIIVMRSGRKVGELLPKEDPDIKEHLIRLMLNIGDDEEDPAHVKAV